MSKDAKRYVVLIVEGRKYYFRRGKNGEYEPLSKRRRKNLEFNEGETLTISLPRKTTLTVLTYFGTVQATCRLNPGYRHHARWLAREWISNKNLIDDIGDNINAWCEWAVSEDMPPGSDPAKYLANLNHKGIALPGQIYRVKSFEIVGGEGA